MHRRANAFGALSFAAVLCLAGAAFADHHIKTGDTIEANWAGGWKPAKVLKVKDNGWATVELETRPGRKMTPTLPPDKLRKRDKDGNVVANPGAQYKDGVKVQAYRDKKWWNGVVVDRISNGSYRVRIDHDGRERVILFKPDHVRSPGEDKPDPAEHGHDKKRVQSDEVRDWKMKDGTPLPRASVASYAASHRKVLLRREKDNVTRFYVIDDMRPEDRDYVLALAKKFGVEDRPIKVTPKPDYSGTFEGRVQPKPADLGAGWAYADGREPRGYKRVTFAQSQGGKTVGRYMGSIQSYTDVAEAERMFEIRRKATASKNPVVTQFGDESYRVDNARGPDHYFRVGAVLITIITYQGDAAEQLCKTYEQRVKKVAAEK